MMIPIPENRIKKSVDSREMVARKCFEKSERYTPDKEVLERLAALSPEMQRKILDQIDGLDPSTPWDVKSKFSMGGDNGWESEEKEVVVPEKYMPGDDGWTNGSWKPIEKSFREMVARKCFEKSGMIPDVEFMDSYTVKKAADETDFDEMADAVSNHNREKEIAAHKKFADDTGDLAFDPYIIENADYYAALKEGREPTFADGIAMGKYHNKQIKSNRQPYSDHARRIAEEIRQRNLRLDPNERASLPVIIDARFKKAALDAESDTPIQDREARRRIGRTTPKVVEEISSLNDSAPLTSTDGQEIGQMAGASSAIHAYDTNDYAMEEAALKNENALEKALRGYLDSNPNITIEDLEKFIESSKSGFRVGVEKPFL
jgi:hypothetical protein